MANERPPIPRSSVVGDDFSRQWGKHLSISLNCVAQERVLAFDLDTGKIIRLKLNDNGKPFVDWQQGRAAQEVISGRVEVEWRDDRAKG